MLTSSFLFYSRGRHGHKEVAAQTTMRDVERLSTCPSLRTMIAITTGAPARVAGVQALVIGGRWAGTVLAPGLTDMVHQGVEDGMVLLVVVGTVHLIVTGVCLCVCVGVVVRVVTSLCRQRDAFVCAGTYAYSFMALPVVSVHHRIDGFDCRGWNSPGHHRGGHDGGGYDAHRGAGGHGGHDGYRGGGNGGGWGPGPHGGGGSDGRGGGSGWGVCVCVRACVRAYERWTVAGKA